MKVWILFGRICENIKIILFDDSFLNPCKLFPPLYIDIKSRIMILIHFEGRVFANIKFKTINTELVERALDI